MILSSYATNCTLNFIIRLEDFVDLLLKNDKYNTIYVKYKCSKSIMGALLPLNKRRKIQMFTESV